MKQNALLLSLLLFCSDALAAKQDACIETTSNYVTAVLVDVSSPLDPPSLLAYETLVDKIISSSPDHSRVDVYKIADGSTGLEEPAISKCKPAPETRFAGAKYWEKRQRLEFVEPVKSVLMSLGQTPVGGQTSPILESIYKISLRSFAGKYAPAKSMNTTAPYGGRLIVISDFIQNSKLINFYSGAIPKYSAWRESVDGRKWVSNFGSIDAQAVIIPREKPNQLTPPGRDFFYGYFKNNFRCIWMSDMLTAAKSDIRIYDTSNKQCAGKGVRND